MPGEEAVLKGRRYLRRPVKTPLEFTPWDPRCIIFGFATDISFGGAFVETVFPASSGSDVVMRLWPSGWDEELILPAVVRWTSADGMGVEFAAIGPRESRSIAKLADDWHVRLSPPPLQVGHHAQMVRRG
jgi:type IV pilus assembly protein PilZ